MDLSGKRCGPCEGGTPPMTKKEAMKYLKQLNGWKLKGKMIVKEFKFKNFNETMEFVNKVADLAKQEDHHPKMHVDYGRVVIEFWTHAINGLSENDFIMAAKIDRWSQ